MSIDTSSSTTEEDTGLRATSSSPIQSSPALHPTGNAHSVSLTGDSSPPSQDSSKLDSATQSPSTIAEHPTSETNMTTTTTTTTTPSQSDHIVFSPITADTTQEPSDPTLSTTDFPVLPSENPPLQSTSPKEPTPIPISNAPASQEDTPMPDAPVSEVQEEKDTEVKESDEKKGVMEEKGQPSHTTKSAGKNASQESMDPFPSEPSLSFDQHSKHPPTSTEESDPKGNQEHVSSMLGQSPNLLTDLSSTETASKKNPRRSTRDAKVHLSDDFVYQGLPGLKNQRQNHSKEDQDSGEVASSSLSNAMNENSEDELTKKETGEREGESLWCFCRTPEFASIMVQCEQCEEW